MDEIRFEVDGDPSTSHFHEELEILYVLSGRTAVMTGQKNFVLGPEDFAVFNPFEHHELYCEAGNHTLSLFIPISVLQLSGIGSVRCCSCIQQEKADYIELIRIRLAVLYKNYMDAPVEQELYIVSQLYGLLAILKQQFEDEEGVGEAAGRDGLLESAGIREAMLYISRHFTEEISLSGAARQAYLSKSHLSRVFKQQTGMNFSDYVRKLRLGKAEQLLRTTADSVTDIALACGFANTNTMIVNFKAVYGQTPGAYRKLHGSGTPPEPKRPARDKASYLRLLKHAATEENIQTLHKQQVTPTYLRIDVRQELCGFTLCHRDSINVGWARFLLEENVRDAVRRSVKDIGFRYLICHGLLDDTLDVYHEDEDGVPWYSFTYIDMIVDFLLSAGILPWIEFCFTPVKLGEDADNVFGDSYVQLPVHLDKWRMLVEAVMCHLIENYGIEETKTWRFSILPALYVSYGVFSLEDYLEYYLCTYRSIRRQLPEAKVFGGAFDVGFLKLDGKWMLREFLDFCGKHSCMPDELCFQSFSCDYSSQVRTEVEEKIRTNNLIHRDEPAPPDAKPDNLKHEIAFLKQYLERYGLPGYPFRFDAWNSTIWQRDLGNDTCFKAAYVVKSYLENRGSVAGLTYCHLTDNTEQRVPNSNAYHGGNGLMTYQGIPKASYYAYCLLNRLGSVLLAQGEGYTVTCSKDKKRFQILLYHYCHYDMGSHVSTAFSEDEQCTVDRYYEFDDPGVRSFRIYLSGMCEGTYTKQSYTINRDTGSSYDKWMEMGAPRVMNQEQRGILENGSIMGYKYEKMRVDDAGEALISAVLDAHEVRLIQIEKK